jgi:hypothetical protein
MNSKTLIRKALSLCLIVAVCMAYSMVTLASSNKIAGELLVSGKHSSVIVNGESAQSGRAIFSTSTIITPDYTSAIISVEKIGKIELAPNTNFNVSFDGKGISGSLLSGKITVLAATEAVVVKTPEGKSVELGNGQSVTTGKFNDDDYRDSNGNCVDADKDGKLECDEGVAAWWLWALVFSGAVAGVVIAATSDNNRVALGGGTTVVSPSR